ncbi:MAG: dihydrodipicolinate reductase [Candidatus Omnitrophica bacterium]|nr:dihydrodipicolinate reductase [Candidatus Omnitrophota bacterium]
MQKIRIIQIGLGEIGKKIVKYISERDNIETVSAVDLAVDKVGKKLRELCRVDSDIEVVSDIEKAIKKSKPDIAVLTTFSFLEKIFPQIELIAKYKVDIISTCEELVFPWKTNPDLAKKIDEIAKENDITILSTGVNPGFLMDSLPIFLTSVCQNVKYIKVSRIQDAGKRRIAFQKKIGVGLTVEEFEMKKKTGEFGHVGLVESLYMIAEKIGWDMEKIEDVINPVIAEDEIKDLKIKKGMVSGLEEIAKGFINGKEVITLVFKAAVGEKKPEDRIEIKGIPDITFDIPGGINGDIATCAIVVNSIKLIKNLPSGLKTMIDIPLISFSK